MVIMSNKYKITQIHKLLDRVIKEEVIEIECSRKPKVGEGFRKLIDPPIDVIIIKVEEVERLND
jgi:hypothetical protein